MKTKGATKMINQVGMFVFAIVSTVTANAYDRNEVYNAGFKEGYSHAGKESGGLAPLKPLAPLTPMPTLGEQDQSDTYNRGVIEGYRKFQEKNSFIKLEQN